jgi:hypothetical protein
MRPTKMRCPRTVRLTAGALAIAAPTSAVALAADQADAQSALQITPAASRLDYGQALTVTGLAPRSDGGQRLALEFSAAGSPWRAIAHTKVHSDGDFRLRASLTRSGAVRVAADPISESRPRPVTVAARLVASTRAIDALSGRQLELRGGLLPRRAGRLVRLQSLARSSWRTIAVARTGAGGHFVLRYLARATGERTVRISFAGDSGNAGVNGAGRKLVLFRPAEASWYEDGGNTACGFHAADGIASKQLPCGTKVTLAYHGRTVTAVVDDRGPYVPGRDFDLDQSTASALGFDGVDTVWSLVAPAPSGARRSLGRKCSLGVSPTSTWTRSTCPLSSGAVRRFADKPWWWREAGRARL